MRREGFSCPPLSARCCKHRAKKALCSVKTCTNLVWCSIQQLFRQFVSDVELVTLDGNGRFLIPKRYMAMAQISQSIRFLGMGDTIEIWSEANTQQPFVAANEFGTAIEAIMAQPEGENQ